MIFQREGAKAEGRKMTENELSRIIFDSALEVHRTLGGPGLLESVYEEAFCEELRLRGVVFQRQVALPVVYKGLTLGNPLKLDVVVGNLVIVECKAVEKHNPVFEAQLLTYLRLRNLKLGMVLNFGQPLMKDGVHRVVNGL